MQIINRNLYPKKIANKCKDVVISSDLIAVIKRDSSLWIAYPADSKKLIQISKCFNDDEITVFRKVMDNVEKISASASFLTIVKKDNTIWCWDYRQERQKSNFVYVTDNISKAVAGEEELLVIDKDKNLFLYRVKGDFYSTKIMENVKSTAVGIGHYAALQENGKLWLWGANDFGQLGNNSYIAQQSPINIMTHISQVSLGARYSAAIDEKNRLWMWGDNCCGQLGTLLVGNRSVPTYVMKDVKEVSTGYTHSGVITMDGKLCTFGYNGKYSALGNGHMRNCRIPKVIGTGAKKIRLGGDRSAVLNKAGSVFAWG